MNKFLSLFFVLITFFIIPGSAQAQSESVQIEGLKAPVTVRKDARSIPYIEAKTDADLYFAQGYVTAGDRLWQMDLMRRVARGETSEIFGRDRLEEDKRWRRFGFAQITRDNLPNYSTEYRTALDLYAKGVNAYIAKLDDKTTPVEFKILQYKPKPWSPEDTLVVSMVLADALSTTWPNDMLRASMQNLPKEKLADLTNQRTPFDVVLFGRDSVNTVMSASKPINVSPDALSEANRQSELRRSSLEMVGLYAEELAASNNFVVSGKRTADGKPILENDPHLAPTAPGIWYLAHLSTPSMRVSGVTVPGIPDVILGHNEYIAWGATNVGPDVQDLYVENFNAEGKYQTPGGWEMPKIRKEVILVRANPLNPQASPVEYDVIETRNGVVISEEGAKKYALKWTVRQKNLGEINSFYLLNRAKNWADFRNAIKNYGGATQNFVFADVAGHIGWQVAGKIPIRKTGDGAMPYDGATNDGDWTGYIPFEELPFLYDPPSGFIVTANQRIVGTEYKYTQMSRDAGSPWRARRIYDLLQAKNKLTLDDARDIQYDVVALPLQQLAKEVVAANAVSAETLALFKAWDGRAAADSKAAVMAAEMRSCVAQKIADANKPIPFSIISQRIVDRAIREKLPLWLPSGFADYTELFKACESTSITNLSSPNRYGPDRANWVWGKAFVSRFPHPLAVAPLIGGQFQTPSVPIDGSGFTPNVGSSVSMRHITSPGNWDATRQVIPLGESGDPKSPHFKDQFEAWRTGTLPIFPFSKSAVETAVVSTTTLSPK